MNEYLFPYINKRLDDMTIRSRGYAGEPEYPYPSIEVIEHARHVAVEYIPPFAPTPNVIPDEDWTGVSFTWHKCEYNITFDVCDDLSLLLWWKNRITLETDCATSERHIKADIDWLMERIKNGYVE